MIVSSVNGNNNGWVVSFGLATAVASVILLAVAAATRGDGQRVDVFEEAQAERFEQRIASLVAGGADERALRELVRDVMRASRR